MNTLKISPRKLVAEWYGDRAVDEDAVHDAVVEMMRRGWLPSFVPRPDECDRNMVFLPQRSTLAAIVRCLDGRGWGVVPRGLIESRTGCPVSCIGTGLVLSNIGIVIMKTDGNNVFIRTTTPGLALIVHTSRLAPIDDVPSDHLIKLMLGKTVRRSLWTDDFLLRVALAYDELQVDVPGLLDGKEKSDVNSRWLFPEPPASRLPQGAPFDPPF